MAKRGGAAAVVALFLVFLMVCSDIQVGMSEPLDSTPNKCPCGVLYGFGSCTPPDPVDNEHCDIACKQENCSKGGSCTEPWGACECKC